MEVYPVDPRDITWDVANPTYRVYFWRGLAREERRITGADDVAEIIDWANSQVGIGQTYTLYVEHDAAGQVGLIKLMGEDPTENLP